jgi:hypothetical protein
MRRDRNRQTEPVAPANPSISQRRVVDGSVQVVLPDGRVRLKTSSGMDLFCRVPMHVDLAWLRAALEKGPVCAEASVSDEGGAIPSLWSLFPGPEHEGVVPDHVHIVASEGIHLVCGASKVVVAGKELRLRSRDVAVTGSRATRLRGGTIKLN